MHSKSHFPLPLEGEAQEEIPRLLAPRSLSAPGPAFLSPAPLAGVRPATGSVAEMAPRRARSPWGRDRLGDSFPAEGTGVQGAQVERPRGSAQGPQPRGL